MDIRAIAERAQAHYLAQLRVFVSLMQTTHPGGRAEVRFASEQAPSLYRGVFCADFAAKTDGHLFAQWLQPDPPLHFEECVAPFDKMTITTSAIRWDGLLILHDAENDLQFDRWFERWFDPEDQRIDLGNQLNGIIHSLNVEPGEVQVDLGSAPAEALLELYDVLQIGGARTVQLREAV